MADFLDDAGSLHGAENRAQLLLARGFGIFSPDKANEIAAGGHICESHFLELVKDWAVSKYNHFKKVGVDKTPQCSLPEPTFSTNLHTKKRDYQGNNLPRLTFAQAAFILRTKKVLLHPGLRKFNFKKINSFYF